MFDYGNPYGMYGIGSNFAPGAQFGNQPMNLSPQYQNAPQRQNMTNNSNVDWIRVNTMDDVANITVQPGKQAWIMLQNEPIFVVKSADAMGLATTDAFRFEKITGEKKPEYVTREEFEAFVKQFEPEKGEDE